MEPNKGEAYQRLLLQSAVLVMACDGEIHADELEELRLASKKTHYFPSLDFEAEVVSIIETLQRDKVGTLSRYFEQFEILKVNSVQKLQVLEILLRIVYADNRVHENESKFLRLVQHYLEVPAEIVTKRFGTVGALGIGRADMQLNAVSINSLTNAIDLTDLPDSEEIASLYN